VRVSARMEEHFVTLQKTLTTFGFDVITNASALIMAMHKRADGTVIEGAEQVGN
jgi:hypothetical protein